MTIEELEVLKKENAAKAKEILQAEDGVVEDAQKLLDENNKINEKIDALKSVEEQLLPVKNIEIKETKMSDIILPSRVNYKALPFTGSDYEKGLKALQWGHFALAMIGNKKSQEWMKENTSFKAANETTNSAGGFLVPEELIDSIIWLRDQYGVVRRNADVRNMNSDVLQIPKNSASPTAYWMAENTNITESSPTFDRVQVLAKKLAIFSQVSTELDEDSIVQLGSHLAQDYAWKIESEIDRVCMIGSSATATDGNINGFVTEVNGVASGQGIVQGAAGSAANYNAITLANFRSMVGKLPLYADKPGEAKWYMSKAFFNDVVAFRLDALAGNAALDIMNFQNGTPTLFGYPIEFSQHLASTAAGTNNAPLCAFGNLKTGTVYGDRRDLSIRISDQYYFQADALAFRATTRMGFVCHDPGTSTAAGSIIVLRRTT
jgi:HK97 family phage major capsid protein